MDKLGQFFKTLFIICGVFACLAAAIGGMALFLLHTPPGVGIAGIIFLFAVLLSASITWNSDEEDVW